MKLFNENEINWQAYELGFAACTNNIKGNPFQEDSDEWFSWNKGWNANYN